jgi:hypothetical protein
MPAPQTVNVYASALKCSLVLDPAALQGVVVPDGVPRVTLNVRVAGRTLSASVNAKGVRRAILAIRDAGPDGVAVVLQGKLAGDVIEEAGLAAQPKPAKPEKIAGNGNVVSVVENAEI